MPAPELNFGGAPHDSDDIQDLWYALEEIGFTTGVISQTDYNFLNDDTLPANGELAGRVKAPGGDSLQGQAHSTGVWTLKFGGWMKMITSSEKKESLTTLKPTHGRIFNFLPKAHSLKLL